MADQILMVTDPGLDADKQLALAAADWLGRHYPGKGTVGHGWAVFVGDGRMEIRCAAFRGNWAYVIYLDQHDGPGLDAEIVRGGGEILERHRIARGARTESTYDPNWFGHMKLLPRNA